MCYGRGNPGGVHVTGKTWGLDLRVWDVERGTAIWADAASKDVVIDMGASSFSPLEHISGRRHGVKEINYMIVTHLHRNHIEDVLRYQEGKLDLHVSTLCHNSPTIDLLEEKIEEQEDDDFLKIAGAYQDFLSRFTKPSSIDPTSENWAKGTTFTTYSLNADEVSGQRYEQMNNLSVVTVIERYGFKLVTAGDLLESGLEKLIEHDEIRRSTFDADVLITPHHGRESSYCPDFVDLVDPTIILISDKSDNGNNHDGYYTPPEILVRNDRTGEMDRRKTLTTRNDGRLRVRANHEDDWLVSYYPHFEGQRAKGAMARANLG